MKNKLTKTKLLLIITVALLLILIGATLIYLLTGNYSADKDAIAAFAADGVSEYEDDDGNMIFEPEGGSEVGFIFYPGGKVDHEAYIPLMRALAEEGVFSVLIDMPFNIAIFDTGAAEDPIERYSDISRWYIGGHSLGGAMAASYAADNTSRLSGVVLLAAYSSEELSLDVLSVYGSEDKVLDMDSYDEYLANLNGELYEHVIEGGCHAYFGMYGEQAGDGTPTITPEEQIMITTDLILHFIYG